LATTVVGLITLAVALQVTLNKVPVVVEVSCVTITVEFAVIRAVVFT
jgi:hypothetical protein